MTPLVFHERLAEICAEDLPRPGGGATAKRHLRLMEVGREDLSLAKLAEAHWDAISILREAGREPEPGCIYGVWASDFPGTDLRLDIAHGSYTLTGDKMFCSGAGLIDRALVTVSMPAGVLVDIDLRGNSGTLRIDNTAWASDAFRLTNTSMVTFQRSTLSRDAVIAEPGWYLERHGFWLGACGPAASWAGGAAGLLDTAMLSQRLDAHSLAHLGAIDANIWAMTAQLIVAGDEIDTQPLDKHAAKIRASRLRHVVDLTCSDVCTRFERAYGPGPLAMSEGVSRRLHEIRLYVRQCHAERDLESLGMAVKSNTERR